MSFAVIDYSEPVFKEKSIYWQGTMTAPGEICQEIFFEFSYPEGASFVPSVRPFLLAFLVPAMRLGLPLKTTRPIDATTLNHLAEWQEALALWRQPFLKRVPIVAPIEAAVIPQQETSESAITAFSGGVDSCFTAFRHVLTQKDFHSQWPLGAALMIGGFDIPLEQEDVFESAWQRSAALLAELEVPLYRLRTNLRQLEAIFGCCWETEAHGIWLAASLACYEGCFNRVIIPSTYIYEKLKLPWSSNPITDPLFSSGRVSYWHDGAAYNKLTKVAAIAAQPAVQQHLRVCWQGQWGDRNCGKCFKCVATQVCFWLSGVDHPACFPQACTLDDVAQTVLRTEQNQYLFEQLHQAAIAQGRENLSRAIAKSLRKHKISHLKYQMKAKAKQLLDIHK